MKTRILLANIVAAALAVITINAFANNTLLTPRAAGNQAQITTGTSDAQPAVAVQTATPRELGNQTATVTGAETTPAKCPAMGSPKSQSLAGSAARTSCCGRTLAACPNMSTCSGAK